MKDGAIAEMELQQDDTWGHFAPMFHLVDAFAIYAITLVAGRHFVLPAYSAQQALQAIGAPLNMLGTSILYFPLNAFLALSKRALAGYAGLPMILDAYQHIDGFCSFISLASRVPQVTHE